MSSKDSRFRELKRRAEEARSLRDKAEGGLERVRRDLRKGFGAGSVKAARRLLERAEADAAAKEAELETALAEYERKWGDG